MSPVPKKLRELTSRLVAEESLGNTTGGNGTYPTFRVLEKLHVPLATLAGDAGYRALLLRARALTKADAPWLESLDVKPDGTIEYPEKSEIRPTREESAKGEHALVARMLALLTLFIGEPLTLRLLHGVWPNVVGEEENTKKGPSS